MFSIQNLSFRYAGSRQQVFSNFSLELSENRIYGLLGKNGTGKSTLLYLLNGLLRPQAGQVKFMGKNVVERHPEVLSEIFLVPEEYSLPSISLKEYVKINAPFYPRFSNEMLRQCLDCFELSADLQLGSLSMGQKKKVFMSFALAAGTRVLLLDEPTNGLDIPSKSQFRKAVALSMSDERIVVVSTHQVRDVDALLDHIVMINQSGVLVNHTVEDICNKYRFEMRSPAAMTPDVVYAESSLQGNYVVVPNNGSDITPINIEILFNAVNTGALSMD
ncbi:MAG: ABC transporter ATP-binding protein [Bacteroidaceae bacterium]|nr:ABC transporter ATP-binding protein [Bacteroidaceae bacterium]